MLWSILILTQPSRKQFLTRLLTVLKPQVDGLPNVEINVRMFDSHLDLGSNRQAMIDAAAGTYCCFIDDDDLVSGSYVSKILRLLDGVDYVGFQLQCFVDGQKLLPTYHSLRFHAWNGDQDGWYRDISHVNPIRRELALQVPLSGGFGEDHRWADAMRALDIVKTEHYIDEIMYFYYFRSNKSIDLDGAVISARNDPNFVGQPLISCPKCGSTACGIAGGMRRCNQCGASWV
jgi:hypothetical protein